MTGSLNQGHAYFQAADVLPLLLRRQALLLPPEQRELAEEFRLRCGAPLSVLISGRETSLDGPPVTRELLEQLVELASRASVHAVLDQLSQGYLTIQGGHRVGLCGTAVLREGQVHTLRLLSSAAVRIARQVPGCARRTARLLRDGNGIHSALILSPPGVGKTTLLRDLIRVLSSGEVGEPLRVGVADERGELAACWDGRPQLDLGPRCDVMSGCPKAQAMLILLRAINPQVLAADEITAPADIDALELAAGCGVSLLATAHGASPEDLRRRPLYRRLLESGCFSRLVLLSPTPQGRSCTVEALV